MVAYMGSPANLSDIILVSTSADGINWNPPRKATEWLSESQCWPPVPSLIQCHDGSYLIAFSIEEPKILTPGYGVGSSIKITKSKDGLEWSEPASVYNSTMQITYLTLIQCRDDSYMISFKEDEENGSNIFVIRSEDGVSWSPVYLVCYMPYEPGSHYLESASLIQKSDGTYTMACVHVYNERGEYYIALFDSSDGVKWHLSGAIQIPSSYWYYVDMIQCNDGSYMIAFDYYMDGSANVYVLNSTDGYLWSKPKKVTPTADSSWPSLVQLENGEYMIAYYLKIGDFADILVTTSKDGLQWSAPVYVTSSMRAQILNVHWTYTFLPIVIASILIVAYFFVYRKRGLRVPATIGQRKSLRLLMIGALIAVPLVGLYVYQSGVEAKDFTLTDVHGDAFSLRDFRGRVVLLDFMATWCGPCKATMHDLLEFSETFGDDLVIISISVDPAVDTDEKLLEWAETYNASWIYARDSVDSPVSQKYKVSGIPAFILFDRNGEIAHRHLGQASTELLREEIPELIEK